MVTRSVAVLGGGVAGLSSALLLARDGNDVVVFDRDSLAAGSASEAPQWDRRGVAHFLQPHAFIPRGVVELRDHLPDVFETLLAVGATPVESFRKIPGEPAAGDEDIQWLAVRRPVIEWALRQAAARDRHIRLLSNVRVDGVEIVDGRAVAVIAGGSAYSADVVVDALGRRTPTPGWLGTEDAEVSECSVIYYSRYYRVRDDFEFTDGPWYVCPKGDLGYAAYSSFPGDNRTFAALFTVPPGDHDWRVLKEAAAFEAAVRQVPPLTDWIDFDGCEPITEVQAIAGLRNVLRSTEALRGTNVFPVGDAYLHTDPVLAHGLAFALAQSRALASALREHDDVDDALCAYLDGVEPEARERFAFLTAFDDQRFRVWSGERLDFAHRDGAYELFTHVAGGAVALQDPIVARTWLRRIGLLDSATVLDNDTALQQHIERRFAEMPVAASSLPSRADLLGAANQAASKADLAGLAAR